MIAIPSDRDQVLADKLEAMMVSIANLPNDEFDVAPIYEPEQSMAEYRAERESSTSRSEKVYRPTARLRAITERHWPELWKEVPDQNTDVETRARQVILKIRTYLRLFWEAKTPRARNWYIFRAREYYERLRILPDLFGYGESVRSSVAEAKLDQPPAINNIERALYDLQKRADFPSKAPRVCPNDDCQGERYFLSKKKGQKFCTQECSQRAKLGVKRDSYHKNKNSWPSTANRRKNRG